MIRARLFQSTVIQRLQVALLGVCALGGVSNALGAASAAINNCPPVEVNPTIRDRLEEARNKYAGNCLSCEGSDCSFNTTLNLNESRICQTLYCQPVKLKDRSPQPFQGSISGLIEYTYSINDRGKITDISLLTEVTNEERRQVVDHIRSAMKGRRFKAIVVNGERLQLKGLYGALEIINR